MPEFLPGQRVRWRVADGVWAYGEIVRGPFAGRHTNVLEYETCYEVAREVVRGYDGGNLGPVAARRLELVEIVPLAPGTRCQYLPRAGKKYFKGRIVRGPYRETIDFKTYGALVYEIQPDHKRTTIQKTVVIPVSRVWKMKA